MAGGPENLLVWMQDRASYVEAINGTLLRIKNPSKLGENRLGMRDERGDLVEITWEAVLKLRPTIIEVTSSKNPCSSLVQVLEKFNPENVSDFFSKVKVVAVNMTNFPCDDVLKLLERFSLLPAFSLADTEYSPDEYERIAKRLAQLNVQAIDFGETAADAICRHLDPSLVKLSGVPPLNVSTFKGKTFVTVKTLLVQDLADESTDSATAFLDFLPSSFPNLKTLIWDWNAVDPEVIADERTNRVVDKLLNAHKALQLETLAVMAYTPCGNTKAAFEGIARRLKETKLDVQVHSFASRGLSQGISNFSFLTASTNETTQAELVQMFVVGRSSMPHLGKLLRLCDPEMDPIFPTLNVEFGGFDSDRVRKLYSEADDE